MVYGEIAGQRGEGNVPGVSAEVRKQMEGNVLGAGSVEGSWRGGGWYACEEKSVEVDGRGWVGRGGMQV